MNKQMRDEMQNRIDEIISEYYKFSKIYGFDTIGLLILENVIPELFNALEAEAARTDKAEKRIAALERAIKTYMPCQVCVNRKYDRDVNPCRNCLGNFRDWRFDTVRFSANGGEQE